MILQGGYKSIIISIVISLVFFAIDCEFLGFIGLIVTVFITYSYRDPIIGFIPKDDDIVMSPIEGKITTIDQKNHNYEVYIDVSLCDASILRAPKNVQTLSIKQLHGMHFCHHTLKAKEFNSQAKILVDDIVVELLAGICNKNFVFDTVKEVRTGDRIGLFFHGVAKIIIPMEKYNLDAKLMSKVTAETKLASLKK